MVTFALAAVIVTGDGLLLQKILYHSNDLSIIMVTKINVNIPNVVKC